MLISCQLLLSCTVHNCFLRKRKDRFHKRRSHGWLGKDIQSSCRSFDGFDPIIPDCGQPEIDNFWNDSAIVCSTAGWPSHDCKLYLPCSSIMHKLMSNSYGNLHTYVYVKCATGSIVLLIDIGHCTKYNLWV